ncbi:hypothetical protein H5410_049727 [Solanum commersonii]|uniref:Uncharacterized protein n=1 Tax=Solanum commersonii TaxID=4109 RepID=A0A9J5WVH8_SOLCO|nr:hypothetical protein H5410_049727 [Solanum commersonii]
MSLYSHFSHLLVLGYDVLLFTTAVENYLARSLYCFLERKVYRKQPLYLPRISMANEHNVAASVSNSSC